MLPLLKPTKRILLPQTIADLMYISFSPNSTETAPAEASICAQSLPKRAAGGALFRLLPELLGHRDTTEPLTALRSPLADFPLCLPPYTQLAGQQSVGRP